MRRIKILSFVLLIILASCKSNNVSQEEWSIKQGYVPDSTTAVQIAQIIFVRVYGDKVLEKKPFKTVLKNQGIWIVEGSLKAGEDGGVPHIEIQKADGKIVDLYHSK